MFRGWGMFDRYEAVLKAAQKIAVKASKDLKLTIQLDEATFKESFLSAEYSSTFHGSEGEINHIKKASHMCFWIVKLKPFRASQPLADKLVERLSLPKTIINLVDADHFDKRKKASETPINEVIALALSDHLIFKGFENIEKKLRESGKDADAKAMLEKLKDNQQRVNRMVPDIILSYREHNYSSRALATMLHLAYSTGHESQHA